MDIVLSKSTWPIIGWVCQILGWLINGIYFCLEKIGIPNIGIAIILYTIIITVLGRRHSNFLFKYFAESK